VRLDEPELPRAAKQAKQLAAFDHGRTADLQLLHERGIARLEFVAGEAAPLHENSHAQAAPAGVALGIVAKLDELLALPRGEIPAAVARHVLQKVNLPVGPVAVRHCKQPFGERSHRSSILAYAIDLSVALHVSLRTAVATRLDNCCG
jgi:hypothetical protein